MLKLRCSTEPPILFDLVVPIRSEFEVQFEVQTLKFNVCQTKMTKKDAEAVLIIGLGAQPHCLSYSIGYETFGRKFTDKF